MPLTLAEKLISERTGREVRAGEMIVSPVDVAFAQDGTGPLAVRQIEKLGTEKLARPERTIFFCDHAAPSPRKELSNDHRLLRAFAKKTGCRLSDIECGVCHQVIAESFAAPGMIVVGADSHSCTAGALGAFATGMGSTDVAVAMALGKTWLRVPETIRVTVTGELPEFVTSKDLFSGVPAGPETPQTNQLSGFGRIQWKIPAKGHRSPIGVETKEKPGPVCRCLAAPGQAGGATSGQRLPVRGRPEARRHRRKARRAFPCT